MMADALERCKELRACLDEEHDRLDVQSDSVDRLLRWALVGNGASAEARLAKTEAAIAVIPEMQETLRVVKLIADAKLQDIQTTVSGAVKEQIDAHDKTTIAYVKAFAPYAATAAAIIVAIFR